VNNTHIKQFTEKKTQRFICVQEVLCRNTIRPWSFVQGAAFEEVMPRRRKSTWAFQDPDSSPCGLCCVPQTLQTHW